MLALRPSSQPAFPSCPSPEDGPQHTYRSLRTSHLPQNLLLEAPGVLPGLHLDPQHQPTDLPYSPDRSCGYLVWMRLVRSPPSSRIMLRGPSLKYSVCSMHHRYSSSVSPFQAYTGESAACQGWPFTMAPALGTHLGGLKTTSFLMSIPSHLQPL